MANTSLPRSCNGTILCIILFWDLNLNFKLNCLFICFFYARVHLHKFGWHHRDLKIENVIVMPVNHTLDIKLFATSGFKMCCAPSTLGALGSRPKYVSKTKIRLETSIKKFNPHSVYNCFFPRPVCASWTLRVTLSYQHHAPMTLSQACVWFVDAQDCPILLTPCPYDPITGRRVVRGRSGLPISGLSKSSTRLQRTIAGQHRRRY